ncbi:MAG: hypothetical protein WED07_02890 [Candidatus Freyarchaeum deiterrae]
MNLNKRLLSYSLVILALEALGLFGSFFILWQSVFYFYSASLIYENVYGVFTTFYYISYSVEPLPTLLAYWLYSRSALPMLWIAIPIYVILKLVLLALKRFNLAGLSILMPLLFAGERFFTTLNISDIQKWLFSLSGIFIYQQQGIGPIVLMVVLFLGVYGVSFFENALRLPMIKRVIKLLKENPELELSEIAKGSGYSVKQLYNILTKTIYQGMILAVLTEKELVAYEKPKAQELIVEAFRRVLQKNERLDINDLRYVMQNSKIWFSPKGEDALGIIKNAQEEGKLLALIIDNKIIIRQSEPKFSY